VRYHRGRHSATLNNDLCQRSPLLLGYHGPINRPLAQLFPRFSLKLSHTHPFVGAHDHRFGLSCWWISRSQVQGSVQGCQTGHISGKMDMTQLDNPNSTIMARSKMVPIIRQRIVGVLLIDFKPARLMQPDNVSYFHPLNNGAGENTIPSHVTKHTSPPPWTFPLPPKDALAISTPSSSRFA